MGVDLQTYRAKIGTFRHYVGVDVVTIVCCVNFSGGLKTVGSVVFVGLLLLLAGIEPNPGPKEDGGTDDIILPKAIKVTGLPDGIDKETLEMIFENTKRQGGGKVKQVSLDSVQRTAIIEFEEQEAVNVVIGKQPTKLLGKEVCVKAYSDTEIGILQPVAIKVTGLPDGIDKDTLEMIFEDTKRHGGGKVKQVSLDHALKSAIIEFEEPTSVAIILGKQPTKFLGKEVTVKAFDVNVEEKPQTSKLIVSGLPDNIDDDILEVIFEKSESYGGGTIRTIELNRPKNMAIIEFEDSNAADIVLGKQPVIVAGKEVKLERYCISEIREPKKIRLTDLPDNIDEELLTLIFEDVKRQGGGTVKNVFLDKRNNTAVIEFEQAEAVDIVLGNRPIKILGKSVSVDVLVQISSGGSRREAVAQTIKNLGLETLSFRKLTLGDVLSIDPYESERKNKRTLTELPILFLKKLMSANSDALDLSTYNLRNNIHEPDLSAGSIFANTNRLHKFDTVSPVDLLLLTFQCCNPEVKQAFIQKLFLCKLAVPFIYHDWFSEKAMVSVWPLRALVIENQFKQNDFIQETEVLNMPTHIVSFGRYGRPLCSKSKLLNGIMSDFNVDTFFNKDCLAGLSARYASNGYAEMFWLPVVDDQRSQFTEPITFINLRGDVTCNFFQTKMNFIASFSDMFVILMDIDDILSSTEILQNLLVGFQLVLLIICSPLDPKSSYIREVLENFVCNVQERSETKMHVICTHTGKIEKNQRDLCVEIAKTIADCLNSFSNKQVTLQSRLERIPDNLETDEDEDCVRARESAKQLLQEMTRQSSQEHWSINVTPVQFIHSRKLGNLLKKMYSKQEKEGYAVIKHEVSTVKKMQANQVTKPMKLFIKLLMHYNDRSQSLHYFMCWLKLFVEREKRQTMVKLNQYHQNLWGTYTKLKRDTKDLIKIKEYENKIQESECKLEEASFGVANIFREIAHLYDAFISVGMDPKSIGLPDVQVMATLCANLFINGHTFELLDGNSLYMTTLWNTKVLEVVHENINKKKVLALSVLGLQSSGKSTLLNTMFGVQFTASAGRCTRGIHAQLVPLNLNGHTLESKQFEYLLIIDTEGLRAPELKETNYKRDNELATIITGLGDITILNVMGENTAEIRDVLQTIVHAFLRLNNANPKIDIKKSCIFIHQNVSDVSASIKTRAGLHMSVEVLDNVTKESAESEGISHITTFDQVIRFNVDNDVWYLPNLWKGNPPMAQINRKYSQRVVEINHELLKRALANTEKSYKSLKEIVIHTEDLWKGVLAEDFVFSFRNSIEKKAFIALEKRLKEELLGIETFVDEKIFKLCREHYSNCNSFEKLFNKKSAIMTEIQILIGTQISTVFTSIEEYFDRNEYKEITVKWKEQTFNKLRLFSSQLFNKKQPEIEVMLKLRE